MRVTSRNLAVAAALAALTAIPAMAQTDGHLRLDSEPGDYVGGGQSLSFDSSTAAFSTFYDGSQLTVTVFPFAGSFWSVVLGAPPGQPLVPGVYEGAVRSAFRPPGQPGIDVFGDGRGCNQTSGRFVVSEAVYGPNNYVQQFTATFEQHCESSTAPALFGEVRVTNPPPPPALELSVEVVRGFTNRITGAATLQGTVSCNKPADVSINGTLTQRVTRIRVARGSFNVSVHCEAPGASWQATVSDPTGLAFLRRYAELAIQASAFDPAYGTFVNKSAVEVIRLTKPPTE